MNLRHLQDKRATKRLDGISLPVEYFLKEKGEPFREGLALAVGEYGLMLTLDESLPLGSKIHLKLHIPIPSLFSPSWKTVPVDAKIIWVDDFQQSNRIRRYGTQFTEVSDHDAASIKRYLQLAQWMSDRVRDS